MFLSFSQTNGYVHESPESKVKRLETDRQSLMLQVSVLTEQVEAQAEKLREMEYDVEGKRQKIRSAEEMYQSVSDLDHPFFTLVNVYVDLVVFTRIQYVHGYLCKHLGIDSSTDHPDRYSNLFLNAYINRHMHAEYFKMI